MNKKLIETLCKERHKINMGGVEIGFIDCYNSTIRNDGICGTITTGVNYRNNTYIIEYDIRTNSKLEKPTKPT
jgi:hypothetical protein